MNKKYLKLLCLCYCLWASYIIGSNGSILLTVPYIVAGLFILKSIYKSFKANLSDEK